MSRVYLVWNSAGNECVGFTDYADAVFASTGLEHHDSCGVSELADHFREMDDLFEGDTLELVEVNI